MIATISISLIQKRSRRWKEHTEVQSAGTVATQITIIAVGLTSTSRLKAGKPRRLKWTRIIVMAEVVMRHTESMNARYLRKDRVAEMEAKIILYGCLSIVVILALDYLKDRWLK